MKSLYSRIFKNSQVIYGRPFQVSAPMNITEIGIVCDGADEPDENGEAQPGPEELLENARKESELIIKEAGLEADRIIEAAKREAGSKAKDIEEEAWQKGYAEGMEAASSQNEAILAEAEKIRRSAEQEHESVMAGLESEIVELVINVARKTVAGELTANREVIRQLVADALPGCSNKNGAVLRVSPEDYGFLEENKERLLSGIEGADMLEIRKDGAMKRGDCVIETPLGSVDAGAGTRLKKIEETFREMLGERTE